MVNRFIKSRSQFSMNFKATPDDAFSNLILFLLAVLIGIAFLICVIFSKNLCNQAQS